MNDQTVLLVVPCFNEEARFDGDAFRAMADEDPALELLFVDDGSTDGTGALLRALAATRPRLHALSLAENGGKGEAVRRGLLEALRRPDVAIVGYLDADLSTPPGEVHRLIAQMRGRDRLVLIAARVSLLGRSIERRPMRHYLGRVFASAASAALGLAVYDTQCGAKLFRRSAPLAAAIAEPFLSRWAFDVELLGRLLAGGPGVPAMSPEHILEEPLFTWRDVPGSKLRLRHMARAARDMITIGRDLARRRKGR